jgi:hypothetical protein
MIGNRLAFDWQPIPKAVSRTISRAVSRAKQYQKQNNDHVKRLRVFRRKRSNAETGGTQAGNRLDTGAAAPPPSGGRGDWPRPQTTTKHKGKE